MLSNTRCFLQGTLTTADTTVSISTDNWGNVASFTGESLVFVSADGKTIEQAKGSAAAGTLTLTKRGMTSAATVTENAALKKEWRAGTQVYITALAPDFVTANGANTFTAKQTFTDVDISGTMNVTGVQNLSNVSDLNVNGKSNPQPNFANTTARDAMYTAPANGDKCTVNGVEQTYNGTTLQRESFGISTPVPNGSTANAGIYQEATVAEIGAGTATGSTGARLVINPSSTKKTSAGAADENKIPVLDAAGLLSAGFIPLASDAEAAAGVLTTKPITPKQYKDNLYQASFYLTASDNLKASADTERTTSSTSYVEVKKITMYKMGTVRIKFDLKATNANGAQGLIYKNGSSIGSVRSETSGVYTTFSEDLSCNAGDYFSLYIKIGVGGVLAYAKNFRIYYDFNQVVDGYIVNTN